MQIHLYIMMCSIFSVVTSYRLIFNTVHSLRRSIIKPSTGIALTTTRGLRSKVRKNSFTDNIASLFMLNKVDNPEQNTTNNMQLKILKYPNPTLRNENEIITDFDDNLVSISSSMLSVMYTSDGVGLAAPQVGINKRLMVFNELGDETNKKYEMILVNPVITSKSDEDTDLKEEGCLSFPQIYGKVRRFKKIDIEYQTITGEKVNKSLEGYPARIFQHEYDHLDKVLFIDRFESDDKLVNQKRLEKLVKKYGPGGSL